MLLALGFVDLRVTNTFRCQNHCTFFTFRAHLFLHRTQDILRWIDILDLVAKNLHSPGIRRLVEFRDDILVNSATLFERTIEIDLADLRTQCRLCELRDGEHIIPDAIGSAARVEHLHVKDAVNTDLHVVLRNTDLFGDVCRLLF